uniref:Uncharacterized protein n=1 Tax=Psilocybe cubensis TaxID=181762 RepID=A0A8H7Y135_PSICU
MDQHTPLLDQNLPAQAPATATAPAGQLALLCAVRFIDPLTFTQIFPYINQFLSHLHLIEHQSQIGFYSGLVESTFAFFQLCSIYQWAHLSDSIGRRPVILAGTFGLAVATVFLGFAASLPAILLSRSLGQRPSLTVATAPRLNSGLPPFFTPSWVNLQTPQIKQPLFQFTVCFGPWATLLGIPFPFFPGPTNATSPTSPLIGGALADPAAQFPGVFDYPFFRDYPYFLPCFVTGMFALLVGVLVACYLEETLPSKRAGRNHSVLQESPSTVESTSPQVSSQVRFQPHLDAAGLNDAPPPMTMAQLLRIPVIRALTFSGVALCFTATAFDALFVLFCYTPIHLGGLSFSASHIGYSLAVAGTSSILIQISCLPTLLTHINHAKLYNICMFFWPAAYLALPFLNVIARRGSLGHNEDKNLLPSALYAVWILIIAIMIMSRIGCLAYSISLVLVKQNAPSPSDLGKTNAIVLWGMCFARAFAPAFVSSIFAVSIDMHIFGGFLWLVIMVIISFAGCVISLSISHSEGYIDDNVVNARLD